MSEPLTDIEALTTALDEVAQLIAISARWQACLRSLPDMAPPPIYRSVVEQAVIADDAARMAVNAMRILLGAEPLPDPADPPPARPDD